MHKIVVAVAALLIATPTVAAERADPAAAVKMCRANHECAQQLRQCASRHINARDCLEALSEDAGPY